MGRTGFVLCDGSLLLSSVLQAICTGARARTPLVSQAAYCVPWSVCPFCLSIVCRYTWVASTSGCRESYAGTFWYKDLLVFNSLAKYPEVEKQDRVVVLCGTF